MVQSALHPIEIFGCWRFQTKGTFVPLSFQKPQQLRDQPRPAPVKLLTQVQLIHACGSGLGKRIGYGTLSCWWSCPWAQSTNSCPTASPFHPPPHNLLCTLALPSSTQVEPTSWASITLLVLAGNLRHTFQCTRSHVHVFCSACLEQDWALKLITDKMCNEHTFLFFFMNPEEPKLMIFKWQFVMFKKLVMPLSKGRGPDLKSRMMFEFFQGAAS